MYLSSQNETKLMTQRSLWFKRTTLWGLAFAAPALIFLAIFNFYPMLYAFFISLHEWDLLTEREFVGFENFIELADDRVFRQSVMATLHYVFFTVVPVWVFSLISAMLLNQIRLFRGFFRSIYFFPHVILLVSAVLIWKLMFNPQGPVNALIESLGFARVNWLSDPTAARWATVVMSWWHATGYYMIIFLAGLQGIPRIYYEASAIDGANGWQRFTRITLPLLRPTMLFVVVLSVINGLKTFAPQRIMTNGGPANSTLVATLFVYQRGFEFLQMGVAAAASIILFVAVLLFTLVQLRFFGAFADE